MKMSKALDPSGIVVEMIQAADDKGALRSVPCSCNQLQWQGTLLLEAEFHCLPIQR